MMSDLHRAVVAEIQAFTPDRTPPLSTIEERKRSRDRRRYAVAGTALSVVAVSGIAVGASLVTGNFERLPYRSAPVASTEPEAAPGPHQERAARLCSAAAETYNGEVVAAYPTTVAVVRDYLKAPPSAGYTLAAPGPDEANPFPPSWSFEAPDTVAAACYVDGTFPTPGPPGRPTAERALIMATGGTSPFLAAAGPKDSITPAPLPVSMEQAVTLPTSGWTPGSNSLTASVGGVVSARRDGDTLCVVLGPSDARTADVEFKPVVWPRGYTATAYPLEIRDPDGQVVAREGQLISFGGAGAVPVQEGTPCMFGRTDAAFVMQELPPAVEPPSQGPDVTFEIAYDPLAYDPETVEPALTRCAELPGAFRADYQKFSLPPIDVITFTGSGSKKQAVEDCLRLVPAARVSIR